MKKNTIFLLLMIIAINSVAQDTTWSTMTRQDYLDKSHNQKATGWIMMGAGIGVFVGGVIYTSASLLDAEAKSLEGGTEEISAFGPVLIVAGAGLMIGSIPVFVASSRNHKTAMSLKASTGTIDLFKQSNFANPYYPAVSLVIPLGRK